MDINDIAKVVEETIRDLFGTQKLAVLST